MSSKGSPTTPVNNVMQVGDLAAATQKKLTISSKVPHSDDCQDDDGKPPHSSPEIDGTTVHSLDESDESDIDFAAVGAQEGDVDSEREIVTVSFGPRGSWFARWSDGMAAWEGLAPNLHAKLKGRLPTLPGVRCLSVSEMGHWAVVFEDGSVATSGITVEGKLREALRDVDAEVKLLILAPGGGWLLVREDGTCAFERLPSGLQELLSRRTRFDPPIDQVAISGFGGWFVRFCDGECEWSSLPKPLQKFLIQMIRKGDPNLLLALSPSDGHSYFVAIGDTAEWVHDAKNFRETLEKANESSGSLNEDDDERSINVSQSLPSSRRASVTHVSPESA